MIETRRLKNLVIFIQTILSFVLSRKIEELSPEWLPNTVIHTESLMIKVHRSRNGKHIGEYSTLMFVWTSFAVKLSSNQTFLTLLR